MLACEEPLPLEIVAVDQLMEEYKLNEAAIVAAVEAVMKCRKQTDLAV